MSFAHAGEAGGVHLEYLLVGGALVVLSVIFFVQRSVKPVVSILLFLGGFALAGGAFALGGGDPVSTDASLRIVAPEDGATVPASEPVTVEVELTGGTLSVETESEDPNLGHYHVFVDGDLVAMPVSDVVEVELEPGEHEIEVEFTQADHTSYDPPVSDTVTVAAE